MSITEYEFDIALSFAGESREYVMQVAHLLRDRGVRVFYDEFNEAELWGKDLYVYFREVYFKKARFTVMFASEAYGRKAWPAHERASAQARALTSDTEYILPCRFDDVEVPGLLPTTHFIDLRRKSPSELAELVCPKLVLAGAEIAPPPFPDTNTTSGSSPSVAPSEFSVLVRDSSGAAVHGASVLAVADNGTHLGGTTDTNGFVRIASPKRRIVTVYCAHPNRAAHVESRHDSGCDLTIILPSPQGVGSMIMAQGTGHIPGLNGRLNPIYASQGQFYIYADNISVNGRPEQPTNLTVNVVFRLEDAQGAVVEARLREIIGRASLIEYRFM
jgi:hypothetical protein